MEYTDVVTKLNKSSDWTEVINLIYQQYKEPFEAEKIGDVVKWLGDWQQLSPRETFLAYNESDVVGICLYNGLKYLDDDHFKYYLALDLAALKEEGDKTADFYYSEDEDTFNLLFKDCLSIDAIAVKDKEVNSDIGKALVRSAILHIKHHYPKTQSIWTTCPGGRDSEHYKLLERFSLGEEKLKFEEIHTISDVYMDRSDCTVMRLNLES
jgi:hypothetical protein